MNKSDKVWAFIKNNKYPIQAFFIVWEILTVVLS